MLYAKQSDASFHLLCYILVVQHACVVLSQLSLSIQLLFFQWMATLNWPVHQLSDWAAGTRSMPITSCTNWVALSRYHTNAVSQQHFNHFMYVQEAVRVLLSGRSLVHKDAFMAGYNYSGATKWSTKERQRFRRAWRDNHKDFRAIQKIVSSYTELGYVCYVNNKMTIILLSYSTSVSIAFYYILYL